MDEEVKDQDAAAMAEGATVLQEVQEGPADTLEPPTQAAILAVYFSAGSLAATVQFPQGGEQATHLVAAAKVFDNLGDVWHEQEVEATGGPGGKVRIGSVDLEVSAQDVVLCYALDDHLRPVYDVTIGTAPRPIHLWAAAQLCRAMASFTVSKAIANTEMQAVQAMQAREQVLGRGLPPELRQRIRG